METSLSRVESPTGNAEHAAEAETDDQAVVQRHMTIRTQSSPPVFSDRLSAS